jgi:hypothetical protein
MPFNRQPHIRLGLNGYHGIAQFNACCIKFLGATYAPGTPPSLQRQVM